MDPLGFCFKYCIQKNGSKVYDSLPPLSPPLFLGVWALPCFETLVAHQKPFWEREFGYEHFLRGRWSLLMVAEFQRVRSEDELKAWEGMVEFETEVGDGTRRKWSQKEERCGWKGYTVVLWSPKVSLVAARGEGLGYALPLYPLTQWDSVWWTWGMLNDVRGGKGWDTGLWGGKRKGGKVRVKDNMTTDWIWDLLRVFPYGVCKVSPFSRFCGFLS